MAGIGMSVFEWVVGRVAYCEFVGIGVVYW